MPRIPVFLQIFVLFAACGRLFATQPVGIIMEGDGTGRIERPGSSVLVVAAPGAELFPGDVFLPAKSPIRFAFCPLKTLQTLPAGEKFQLDAAVLPATIPFGSRTQTALCELPDINPFAQTPTGSRRDPKPAPAPDSQIGAIDETLAAAGDAPELLRRIARAVRLNGAHFPEEAVLEYDRIGKQWAEAKWTVALGWSILDESEKASARGTRLAERPSEKKEVYTGKTYALIIGTSKYKDVAIPQLQFAAIDAESFARFLESERGGKLTRCGDGQIDDCNMKILTDEKATLAAVSDSFETFIRAHQGVGNRLIIFIAGHGVDPAFDQDLRNKQGILRQPVILIHDSSYSDSKLTGYLMKEVNEHASKAALTYGRVIVFADVCHAYNVGYIPNSPALEPDVQAQLDGSGLAYFMASAKNENSWESSSFGGGHGAFTFSVLEALSSRGLPDDDLTYGDLDLKTKARVSELTNATQHTATNIPFANLPVIPRPLVHAPTDPLTLGSGGPMSASATRRPKLSRGPSIPPPPATPPARPPVIPAALGPDETNGAWQTLQEMRAVGKASTEEIGQYARRLRIALEDRGQQALIDYLQGDEVEPKQATFTRCASDFAAALQLAGVSPFDESRELFCLGRALLFDAKFEESERALLGSIRLDPTRSYSYNALGITYLEQATRTPDYFARAQAAFESAARYAPYWTYPWHNLALLATEKGDYDEAISDYRHAMEIDPSYSYLPYNLGLLYQRLNRKSDAQQNYELALRLADISRRYGNLEDPDGRKPQESAAHNALGALAADKNRWGKAEALYRSAISDDKQNLDSRHNLAVLLTRGKNPAVSRRSEAEDQWAYVLRQDEKNIPARLARARYFVRLKRPEKGIADFGTLLTMYPDLQAARRELADALILHHEPSQALARMAGLRNLSAVDIQLYRRIALEAQAQKDDGTRQAALEEARKLTADLARTK